jgi:hypothetical protein
MSHKPRRWYSSPEVNPSPDPPAVPPPITPQLLRYGARVRKQHGPALKLQSRAGLFTVAVTAQHAEPLRRHLVPVMPLARAA